MISPYRIPAERARTGGRWPGKALLGAGLALCVVGCSILGGTKTTKAPDPLDVATNTATLLGDAWVTSATSCLAYANAQPDTASKNAARVRCDAVLSPVRDSVLLLDAAVGSWTAADQKRYPCLVQEVVQGLQAAQSLFGPAPQNVQDAIRIAGAYAGGCKP